MKKIFTLLWLTLAAFMFKASAQTTNCNAEFAAQYINSNTVKFNPLITAGAPLVSHYWLFGDGSPVDSTVSPTHIYTTSGTYAAVHTIVLRNNNGAPVCTQSFTRQVTVTAPCNLVVDFSWSTSTTTALTINFQNLSVPLSPTDSITWQFGDGSSSHDVNPVHTYATAGTYTVCLIVKKNTNTTAAPCIKYICKTVVVQQTCNLVVNFSSTATASNPLQIEFHNLSTPISNTDSIKWTFGDGSSSTAVNPVHTYNVAGTYTVCLRIKKLTPAGSAPCIREICKTIVVNAPCNIQPNFTWTATATNPLQIEFHNTSTNTALSDSIRWTFGDGGTSNVLNPVHTYNVAGTYTVCLRIIRYYSGSTTPCIREICKTIVVYQPCNLVVNFSSQPNPSNPLQVSFTNLSTPSHATDSLKWTFGDGTSLSGVQGDPNVANPTHVYAHAGSFTVCLLVKKNINTTPVSCVRDKCETITVHAPCNLVVNFTSQPDPNHPLRVKFTNTSTPLQVTDSIRWTFGDGTSVSGVQGDPNVANPTHNYTSAGNYIVCLRVKKNITSTPVPCVRDICRTIVVTNPCNFNVDFSWRLDSANNRKVYFTNLTNSPTATAIAVWNFGDGSSATSWNAVHEYAQPGRYIVCLRIYAGTNTTCVREKCDTVFIPHPMPSCLELSKFHFERFSNDNQKFTFTADYINPNLQYTWTFGDGTGSQSPVAIHRYAQPGTYTACLTVWRGPNCASTTCKVINVQPQVNCDTSHAGFTYMRFLNMPNKIQFTAHGTLPILDQTWTITKLGVATMPPVVLHQNNPVYVFQDTGHYRVCLRAVMQGGCVKEFCQVIVIEHVSNACILQVFPSPASTTANVNVYLTQPETIHAYVFNSQNVLVLDKHQQGYTGNNLVNLQVANLPAGQYVIRVIYGNKVCYGIFQKL
ncbi:MAG: PKD domain-containing protein [Chitinophagaceae bacterium]|nr:PKD domain-containing protein [Chitinophagaceae bacterium]